MKKVFLGGTCNESKWRDHITTMLKIDYFNPVVDDWTPDCQAEELQQRKLCDFCLYTITPKMTGVYSIAEVVDDSNKSPKKTIFVTLRDDAEFSFNEAQWRSLSAVSKLVKSNGGQVFNDLKLAADFMNESTG